MFLPNDILLYIYEFIFLPRVIYDIKRFCILKQFDLLTQKDTDVFKLHCSPNITHHIHNIHNFYKVLTKPTYFPIHQDDAFELIYRKYYNQFDSIYNELYYIIDIHQLDFESQQQTIIRLFSKHRPSNKTIFTHSEAHMNYHLCLLNMIS